MSECEALEQAVDDAQTAVRKLKIDIHNLTSSETFPKQKLGLIASKVTTSINPQAQTGLVTYVGLENIESKTGVLVGNVQDDYVNIKSSKTCFIENDLLFGKLRPNLNKVYLAKEAGVCSTDILVFRFVNKNLAKFYAYYFLTEVFNHEVLKGVTGQQLPRTSWVKLQEINIPVPSLEIQTQLVAEITVIEQQIAQHQATINQAASLKQVVMQKYL